MVEINEFLIDRTIKALENVLIAYERGIKNKEKKENSGVSIKDCYDHFMGLPKDHNMRKKYNEVKVWVGYHNMNLIKLNPEMDCNQMDFLAYLKEIFAG
jgi:hypothetical protein